MSRSRVQEHWKASPPLAPSRSRKIRSVPSLSALQRAGTAHRAQGPPRSMALPRRGRGVQQRSLQRQNLRLAQRRVLSDHGLERLRSAGLSLPHAAAPAALSLRQCQCHHRHDALIENEEGQPSELRGRPMSEERLAVAARGACTKQEMNRSA
mmetsp:Transcript_129722/g.225381  ORF Transcript_129722/g.225381 Transcript_129722/m.225381 type:complete len:153 (+) Transcript_129722:1972-2430(+)